MRKQRKATKKGHKRGPRLGNKSVGEEVLLAQLKAEGIAEPKRQYHAIPGRRFAHDFAWPEAKLLVEVQGGVFIKGAHTTGAGVTRDCEKISLAVCNGWRQINVTSAQVQDGSALSWIKQILWDSGEVADAASGA